MTTHKLRKAPLWAPVVDGRARLDLGLLATRRDAIDKAYAVSTVPGIVPYVVPNSRYTGARRVWIAVERP